MAELPPLVVRFCVRNDRERRRRRAAGNSASRDALVRWVGTGEERDSAPGDLVASGVPLRVVAAGGGAVHADEGTEGGGADGGVTVGSGGEEQGDGAGVSGPAGARQGSRGVRFCARWLRFAQTPLTDANPPILALWDRRTQDSTVASLKPADV
jgi:hypothetical protein